MIPLAVWKLCEPVLVSVAAFMSLVSVLLTIRDKRMAKADPRRRVPEKILLLTALFGFALPEYVTMKAVRHKTKHKKFMAGLPAIMVLHLLIMAAVWFFVYR